MRKKTSSGPRESALANGWTVEAEPTAPEIEGSAVAAIPPGIAAPEPPEIDATAPSATASGQLSNAALVLLGVFGGLYLLYAWVWLSWAQFYAAANAELASASGSLGGALQQIVFWAAPLAPILWFVSALLLNRRAGVRRLALWIVIGAVVLLPLPVFGGGSAS